jgi:acyl-CoA reductase-like NAD-dependent aldehyde dehydrogenase
MVAPTVLSRTTATMKVECEEVFAPVMTIAAYDEPEEALRRVNASRFGLQAGIFTNDLAFVTRAFETLEVGGIVVNDVPTWRADRMPYGGVKDSGNAREGPAYAMDEMTEPRLLVVRTKEPR